MSYDLGLVVDVGGEWPAPIDGCQLHGVTWNVRPMFARALQHEDGIRSLNGLLAGEAAALAEAALQRIAADRPAYEALNPSNGWGSVDTVTGCLEAVVKWGRRYPLARLRAE